MAIMISSMVFPLLYRVREIDAELTTCTDDAKRRSLLVEREIKHGVLSDLLAAATPVPRRKAKQWNSLRGYVGRWRRCW
jgi:hypothetical protein